MVVGENSEAVTITAKKRKKRFVLKRTEILQNAGALIHDKNNWRTYYFMKFLYPVYEPLVFVVFESYKHCVT